MFKLPLPPTHTLVPNDPRVISTVVESTDQYRNKIEITLQMLLHTGVVVVVGANGSGKSRYTAWLGTQQILTNMIHRVSAKRILDFPTSINPFDRHRAEVSFFELQEPGFLKLESLPMHERYAQSRMTGSKNIDDIWRRTSGSLEILLSFLFADTLTKDSLKMDQLRKGDPSIESSLTALHDLQDIWHQIFPGRRLLINKEEWRITIQNLDTGQYYEGSSLSDGERAGIYLIGSVLLAPPQCIIVIDEPETHLHRSIQAQLYNTLESIRRDCQFVYLTHDFHFAMSRQGAPMLWLQSYNEGYWQWKLLDDAATSISVPEEMLLTLIGSRKPILFVEGGVNSLDKMIYQEAYPHLTVIPCNFASDVIDLTRAFRAQQTLHEKECYGLIDRDQRPVEDLARLKDRGIFTLQFNEIENLLLHPDVITWLAQTRNFTLEEIENTVTAIKQKVMEEFLAKIDTICIKRTQQQISEANRDFNQKKMESISDIVEGFQTICAIDPEAIYKDQKAVLEQVASNKDYEGVLRYYPNKGLKRFISNALGVRDVEEEIARLIRVPTNRTTFRNLLTNLLPTIPP